MRVIRLVEGSSLHSLPMLYLHFGSKNELMVNGKPAEVFASGPGEIENLKDGQWGIVLSLDCPLQEGSFMEIGTNGPVFWIGEPAGTSFRLETASGGFVSLSEKAAMLRPMRVGVLTVSDKGSRGERKDTAGPALAELVAPLGAVVARTEIVPDDRLLIAETLRTWADRDELQLVLVTGGTGLSDRDVTPEALQDVAERIVPGLGEAMRRKTEPLLNRSILSRSIAVTRGKCLVIAFPGSERGARQCFESIAAVLRHAVEILNGWEGECAAHPKHGHSHG